MNRGGQVLDCSFLAKSEWLWGGPVRDEAFARGDGAMSYRFTGLCRTLVFLLRKANSPEVVMACRQGCYRKPM